MRQISRFIFAGMLGLLTLPAEGTGRRGAAHAYSGAGHVPTHSPQPPKVPSVGAEAPSPVAAHRATLASVAAAAPAVADNDPVQDLLPVSDSPNDVVAPTTTFQPGIPSFNEFENGSSHIRSNAAVRAGADATSEIAAPRSGATMWAQIDAASSRMRAVLNTQPDYWAAVARLASAEQKLVSLRSNGQKDSHDIRLADQQALEARQEITQMQMSTLETDPNFQAALTRD